MTRQIEPVDITSPRNPRVHALTRLRRPAERRRRGVVLVEGAVLLRHALAGGWRPVEVFYAPDRVSAVDRAIVATARRAGAQVWSVGPAALARLSARDGPSTVVATVASPRRHTLAELPRRPCPLVVVAQSIEKPGNLGVIARSASAAGADALLVADPLTDPFGAGCVHASLGAMFWLPVAVADTPDILAWLRRGDVRVLVATPAGSARHDEQDMAAPTAVVVGNEHVGVDERWLAAGIGVRIDMVGPMDSLNASVAAAVLLFEAARQRSRGTPRSAGGTRSMGTNDPGGDDSSARAARRCRLRPVSAGFGSGAGSLGLGRRVNRCGRGSANPPRPTAPRPRSVPCARRTRRCGSPG